MTSSYLVSQKSPIDRFFDHRTAQCTQATRGLFHSIDVCVKSYQEGGGQNDKKDEWGGDGGGGEEEEIEARQAGGSFSRPCRGNDDLLRAKVKGDLPLPRAVEGGGGKGEG